MNEASQNAHAFDPEAIVVLPGDCNSSTEISPGEMHSESFESSVSDSNSLEHEVTQISESGENQGNSGGDCATSDTAKNESLTGMMDWQRVAHKLREYNRKLLKKVFRLEQELAEIDNKFNKYVEKSRNSDVLLVRQAEELEAYQEQVALLIQQLAGSQQQIEHQELLIKQVSQQHELSQQQTAQLERECTLLQEKYNQKAFELAAKEQESQSLQNELNQQQHSAQQQEAKLKRYQEAALRKEKTVSRHQNYPHNRFIQPWSNSTIAEPKITLPKNKNQSATAQKPLGKKAETIPSAAKIATWSGASGARNKVEQTPSAKSNHSQKPQSLAAVDLPTFPRPQ